MGFQTTKVYPIYFTDASKEDEDRGDKDKSDIESDQAKGNF